MPPDPPVRRDGEEWGVEYNKDDILRAASMPDKFKYNEIEKLRVFDHDNLKVGGVHIRFGEKVKESCTVDNLSYKTFAMCQAYLGKSIQSPSSKIKVYQEKKSTTFSEWVSKSKKITQYSMSESIKAIRDSVSRSLSRKKRKNNMQDLIDEAEKKIVVCPLIFCADDEPGNCWHLVTLVFYPCTSSFICCEIHDYNGNDVYTNGMVSALRRLFKNDDVIFFMQHSVPIHCMLDDVLKVGIEHGEGKKMGICFTACMFIFWAFHKVCCSETKTVEPFNMCEENPERVVQKVNSELKNNLLTWFKQFLKERVPLAQKAQEARNAKYAAFGRELAGLAAIFASLGAAMGLGLRLRASQKRKKTVSRKNSRTRRRTIQSKRM